MKIKSLVLNNKNLTFFNSNKDFKLTNLVSLNLLNLKLNFLNSLGGIVLIKSLIHLDLSNNFLTE